MPAIGVGVIGASPGHGWSAGSHVPALQALPDYELVAVSTSRGQSAEAAAAAWGVAAFDSNDELIAHPGVDLVVVSVNVRAHHQIASAALSARWSTANGR